MSRARIRRLEERSRELAAARCRAALHRLTDEQLVRIWWPGAARGEEGAPLDAASLWAVLGEVGITEELVEATVAPRHYISAAEQTRRLERAIEPLEDIRKTREKGIFAELRRLRAEREATTETGILA